MNKQIQDFARNYLKTNAPTLPPEYQRTFKLMYARDGGKRSVEDAVAMDIVAVIDEMHTDKLDWAMQQVEESMKKLSVPTNAKGD